MKKWILRVLMLLSAVPFGVSLAGGVEYAPRPFNGMYTGFGIGYDRTYFRDTDTLGVRLTAAQQALVNAPSEKGSKNSLRNAAVGNIFLGGGVQGDLFYFGGEFLLSFAGPTKTRISDVTVNEGLSLFDIDTYENRLNTTTIALDLNPGLLISKNTLLYLAIGVAFNKFKRSLTATAKDSSGTVLNSAETSFNKSITGLRAGIGMKQKISEQVAILLNYMFTRYGKKSLVNDLVTPPVEEPGIRPARHDIMLGLDWYFSS